MSVPLLRTPEMTRRYILTLWSCQKYDTVEISRLVKLPEAEIYNILAVRGLGKKEGEAQ